MPAVRANTWILDHLWRANPAHSLPELQIVFELCRNWDAHHALLRRVDCDCRHCHDVAEEGGNANCPHCCFAGTGAGAGTALYLVPATLRHACRESVKR